MFIAAGFVARTSLASICAAVAMLLAPHALAQGGATIVYPTPALPEGEVAKALAAMPAILTKIEGATRSAGAVNFGQGRTANAETFAQMRGWSLVVPNVTTPLGDDFVMVGLAADGAVKRGLISATDYRHFTIACAAIAIGAPIRLACGDGEEFEEKEPAVFEFAQLGYLRQSMRHRQASMMTESTREKLFEFYTEARRTKDAELIEAINRLSGMTDAETRGQEVLANVRQSPQMQAVLAKVTRTIPYWSSEELAAARAEAAPVLVRWAQTGQPRGAAVALAAMGALRDPKGPDGVAAIDALTKLYREDAADQADARDYETILLTRYALLRGRAPDANRDLLVLADNAMRMGFVFIAEAAALDALWAARQAGRGDDENSSVRVLERIFSSEKWKEGNPRAFDGEGALPSKFLALMAEADPAKRRAFLDRPKHRFQSPQPYSRGAVQDLMIAAAKAALADTEAFIREVRAAHTAKLLTGAEAYQVMMFGMSARSTEVAALKANRNETRLVVAMTEFEKIAAREQTLRPVARAELERYFDPYEVKDLLESMSESQVEQRRSLAQEKAQFEDYAAAEPLLRAAVGEFPRDEFNSEEFQDLEADFALALFATGKDAEAAPMATRTAKALSQRENADSGVILRLMIASGVASLKLGKTADAARQAAALNKLLVGNSEAAIEISSLYGSIMGRKTFDWSGEAARLFAATGDIDQGFALAQRAQLTLTSQTMQGAFARYAAADPQAQAALRNVQDIITQGALGAQSTSSRERTLAYMRMMDEVRARAPNAFQLFDTQNVPATSLKGLLAPDEALVMIVPTRDEVLLFTLRGDRLSVDRAATPAAQVEELSNRLRGSIEAPEVIRAQDLPVVDLEAAHALYKATFQPLEQRLAGVKTVHVLAGGALQRLPLHALAVEPARPAGANGAKHAASDDFTVYRTVKWLADRYNLTHVPSVATFRALRLGAPTRTAGERPFLGFGGPANLKEPAAGGGPGRVDDLFAALTRSGSGVAKVRDLPALPGAAESVRSLAERLGAAPGSALVGSEMSEARLRQLDQAGELARTRVIAFATHGLYSGELAGEPPEPALIFTPPLAAAAPQNDGLLLASEIARLKLNADWVLLLACNTAETNAPAEIEPLSGLAQSFLVAGARSLLISHWRAGDQATNALAGEIFAQTEGDKAARLHASMRKLRQEGSPLQAHPAVWAPFFLVGDSR
jgi:CHAT domain-containing protein